MMNRIYSVVAIVGLSLAGAACESTGGTDWSAQNNDSLNNKAPQATHTINDQTPIGLRNTASNNMGPADRATQTPGNVTPSSNLNANNALPNNGNSGSNSASPSVSNQP